MSNNFSVGVMIGGIVGSSFRSAVSGTGGRLILSATRHAA